MKVSLVFDVDTDLGPDPLDEAKDGRSLGVFIDSDKDDVLLLHRQYGDQYQDGNRTHIYGSGIWENLNLDQLTEAIERLRDL